MTKYCLYTAAKPTWRSRSQTFGDLKLMCIRIWCLILPLILEMTSCAVSARCQCDLYYEKAFNYIRKDSIALETFNKNDSLDLVVYDSTVSAIGGYWTGEICRMLYNVDDSERWLLVSACDSLRRQSEARSKNIKKEYKAALSKLPDSQSNRFVAYFYDYNDSLLIVNLLMVLDGVDISNYRWASFQGTKISYLFIHRDCEIVDSYISGPWYP